MEPQRLVGQPVYTDDHRGRYVGRLEEPAPLRDQLTVTGEHDCLGRIRRDVHRDLPTTVVVERLGDELSRYRVGLVIHGCTSRIRERVRDRALSISQRGEITGGVLVVPPLVIEHDPKAVEDRVIGLRKAGRVGR